MTVQVGRVTPPNRPGLATWQVADNAERDALTTLDGVEPIKSADIGRVCRVGTAEPYTYYELTGISPLEWATIGGGAGGGSGGGDSSPELKGYQLYRANIESASGTVNVDVTSSNYFKVTLAGDATIQFTNNDYKIRPLLFEIVQDGAGGHSILSWDESTAEGSVSDVVLWPGGAAPTITKTAEHSDLLMVYLGVIGAAPLAAASGIILGQDIA